MAYPTPSINAVSSYERPSARARTMASRSLAGIGVTHLVEIMRHPSMQPVSALALTVLRATHYRVRALLTLSRYVCRTGRRGRRPPVPTPDFVALVDQVLHGSPDEQEMALSALEEPRNRRPLKRAPAEHPELRDSAEKLYASATPRVRALALAISDSAELASRAIRDEDAGIRERATEVLVKAGDATLLTDERPSVRVRILRRPRWLVTQRRSSWSSVRRNRAS